MLYRHNDSKQVLQSDSNNVLCFVRDHRQELRPIVLVRRDLFFALRVSTDLFLSSSLAPVPASVCTATRFTVPGLYYSNQIIVNTNESLTSKRFENKINNFASFASVAFDHRSVSNH